MTEAKKKVQKKYHDKNTKLMQIRLNLRTDADIIKKLDAVKSK